MNTNHDWDTYLNRHIKNLPTWKVAVPVGEIIPLFISASKRDISSAIRCHKIQICVLWHHYVGSLAQNRGREIRKVLKHL